MRRYSQYPHSSFFNCTFVVGGQCASSPKLASKPIKRVGSAAASAMGTSAAPGSTNVAAAKAPSQWMGFTIRDESYRFTAWVPWDDDVMVAAWNDTANQYYELCVGFGLLLM